MPKLKRLGLGSRADEAGQTVGHLGCSRVGLSVPYCLELFVIVYAFSFVCSPIWVAVDLQDVHQVNAWYHCLKRR